MALKVEQTAPVTTEATSVTLTRHELQILALVDGLKWQRLKLASILDKHVEPDDINTDDTLLNAER